MRTLCPGYRQVAEPKPIGKIPQVGPDERYTMWQECRSDLVLLITCVPAYVSEEVVFAGRSLYPSS